MTMPTTDTPLVDRVEALEDGWVAVHLRVFEHRLDFTAWEATALSADGPLFWRRGSDSNGDPTPEREDAEPYVRGTIKWDGCSHLWFGDDDGYVHLCGRSDFDRLRALLDHVWAVAAREIPSFDPYTAG